MKFCFLFLMLFAASAAAQSPATVEREIVGHLDAITKYGSYGDSYDEAKLTKHNELLKNTLIRNGKRSEILHYAFPKLDGKMFVATSADGKLRVYSWDLETGGTMHDFESVYQYRGKSGKVYTWTETRDDESAGTFCTQIFDVPSANGTIYLTNSTFIGSTSLAGQSIDVVRIDGEKLDTKAKLIRTGSGLKNSISFGYDFFSVVDHPERPVKLVYFNAAKKEFRFPVVIEDDKTPQGRVTNKFITYRFNGKYFVRAG